MFAKAEYAVCGMVAPARRGGEGSTPVDEEERLEWLVREKIGAKLVAAGHDIEAYEFAP